MPNSPLLDSGFLVVAMPILLFVVFGLLVVGLIACSSYASRKRQQALVAWAAAHDLAFSADQDGSVEDRFPAFSCLRAGDGSRYAYNRMQGKWGERPLLAFDYHYVTHSTNSKGHRSTHHHHFSAVILFSSVPLKPLSIRSENFLDKVGAFFGHEDINFESAEFSRRFYVKAPDRKWAYDVIHQRTMEFLLSMPVHHLQFDADCVMAWRDTTFSADEFATAANLAAGVLDGLPPYLVAQQMEAEGRVAPVP